MHGYGGKRYLLAIDADSQQLAKSIQLQDPVNQGYVYIYTYNTHT